MVPLLVVGIPLLGLLILSITSIAIVRSRRKRELRRKLEQSSYGLTAQWGGPGYIRSDW